MRQIDKTLSLSSIYVRRNYQISAKLYVRNHTPESTVFYSSTFIYNWARSKFSQFKMPNRIQSYSRDQSGLRVHIIYDENPHYFCMYAEHPDENVAGRIWIIEAEIAIINGEPRLAVRVSFSTAVGTEAKEPGFSIPRFVKKIADKNGLLDVKRLINMPHKIETNDKADELIDFIQNDERNMPVIVISERRSDNTYSGYLTGLFVEADSLAANVGLLAHIYTLDADTAEYFSEKVGRPWGVFNGAVRTYYSGVDFESSDYYTHPFATTNSIMASYSIDEDGKELIGIDAFGRKLENKIKHQSVRKIIDWSALGHKFYYKANRDRLTAKQEKLVAVNGNNEEWKRLYEEEIESLKQDLKAKDDEYAALFYEYESKDEELIAEKTQNHNLKLRIANLNERLEMNGVNQNTINIPKTYSEMPAWINEHFPERLVLLPRAEKAIKKAAFDNIELVYQALILLGTTYYKMRIGNEVSKDKFDEECNKLGIEESKAISENRLGERGDTYRVWYKGAKHNIERHIKTRTITRDPAKCLRIYFFWDDEESMVVICSLPEHLEIRSS